MRTNRILICRSLYSSSFQLGEKLRVFNQVDDTLDKHELHAEHAAHVVQHKMEHEAEAFYKEAKLYDLEELKKKVTREQLRVSEKVWRAIKKNTGQDPALAILAQRIRTRCEREQMKLDQAEREDMNFAWGALVKLKDYASGKTSKLLGHETKASERVAKRIGKKNDVAEMLAELSGNVKSALEAITDPPDAFKKIMGVLTGTEPATNPPVEEVLKAMEKATPGKLKSLKTKSYQNVDGKNVFDPNPDFDNLILFRKIAIEETVKMVSIKQHDTEHAMEFWDHLKNGKQGSRNYKKEAEEIKKKNKEKADAILQKAENDLVDEEKRIGDELAKETISPDEAKTQLEAAKSAFKIESDKAEKIIDAADKIAEDLLKARPDEIAKAEKETFTQITKDILKSDTLYSYTQPDPVVLQLQLRLREIYQHKGALALKKMVDEIYHGLDTSPEKMPEGEGAKTPKSLEKRKTIQEQKEVLFNKEKQTQLLGFYNETKVLRKSLKEAEDAVTDAKASLATLQGVIDATPNKKDVPKEEKAQLTTLSNNVKDAENKLQQQRKEETAHLKKVNDIELAFISAADEIRAAINVEKLPKDGYDELKKLATELAKFKPSSPEQLFAADEKDYSKIMQLFTGDKFKKDTQQTLREEIDKADVLLNPRTKISPRQLLTLLNRKEIEEDGTTNPEEADNLALLLTNAQLASIERDDTNRAANREIAEYIQGGVRGWAHRKYELLAKSFFDSEVFGAEEVIEHVSGLHKKFKPFARLNKHSTLIDIRKAAHSNGHHMTSHDVREFYKILQRILETSTIQDGKKKKKIKIYDKDWDIADLIHNLQYFEGEVAAHEAIHDIIEPHDEENKKLTKAQRFMKLIEKREIAEKNEHPSIKDRVDKALGTFWSKILGKEWAPKVNEALAEYQKAIGEGSTTLSFKEYAEDVKGIPETILRYFTSLLALKEGYDIVAGGARLIKRGFAKGVEMIGPNPAANDDGKTKGDAIRYHAPAPIHYRPFSETLPGRAFTAPFRLARGILSLPGKAWQRAKAWNRKENERVRHKLDAEKAARAARAAKKSHGGGHGDAHAAAHGGH